MVLQKTPQSSIQTEITPKENKGSETTPQLSKANSPVLHPFKSSPISLFPNDPHYCKRSNIPHLVSSYPNSTLPTEHRLFHGPWDCPRNIKPSKISYHNLEMFCNVARYDRCPLLPPYTGNTSLCTPPFIP